MITRKKKEPLPEDSKEKIVSPFAVIYGPKIKFDFN